MTTLREAAAMALDALEWCEPAGTVGYGGVARRSAAIAALREALAAPEPVAWRYKKEGGGWFVSDNEPQYVEQWNDIEEIQPLYAAPPAAPADEIAALRAEVAGLREALAGLCIRSPGTIKYENALSVARTVLAARKGEA